MMASPLNKRIYKERRKLTKEASIFSTNSNVIKRAVKLYLFIENKELSFNVDL